jgi:Tfp pilus assembly protein PilO
MGVLRNLFGSVTRRMVRLAVVASILFCAYLFVVKPAIEKTGDAFHSGERHLVRCFKHNHQDVARLERCTRRF